MPAMTARAYAGGIQSLLNKEGDVDTDSIFAGLLTASYSENYDTHRYWADVTPGTNELANGSGYTTNGLALSSLSLAKVAANSFAQVWTATTAYTAGQLVRPVTTNGLIYVCTVAGTSAGSEPTWMTTLYRENASVDGSVRWTAIGRGAVIFDFADPSWANFSAGPFQYAVVYDRSPATDATRPLLCAFKFASAQTGGGGAFTITVDASGALVIPY
jgi:hypothetical protein